MNGHFKRLDGFGIGFGVCRKLDQMGLANLAQKWFEAGIGLNDETAGQVRVRAPHPGDPFIDARGFGAHDVSRFRVLAEMPEHGRHHAKIGKRWTITE